MKQKELILILLTVVLTLSSCAKSPYDAKDDKGYKDTDVLLTVASQKVEVAGLSQYGTFLAVKSSADEDDWLPFYNVINGFDYESGYEYIITVYMRTYDVDENRTETEPEYFLKNVISKVEKQSDGLPRVLD
ncbi:MAG: DUF4377 domain-containing protein [Bacteroidales bacterium]|nr:DUF4377 domain-containing protein [Bacteroidales bacterium]MDD4670327.1 DUF4377 domain-containing protein [Bacteroidales bacterium]